MKTYTGDKLSVLCMFEVPVNYSDQNATLPIIVEDVSPSTDDNVNIADLSDKKFLTSQDSITIEAKKNK